MNLPALERIRSTAFTPKCIAAITGGLIMAVGAVVTASTYLYAGDPNGATFLVGGFSFLAAAAPLALTE